MTNKNDQEISHNKLMWLITAKVYDFFQQMGGSAQYSGFRYWHVPAFIMLKILSENKDHFSRGVESLISPRIQDLIENHVDEWLSDFDKKLITKQDLTSYAIDILSRLVKTKYWIDEVDEWTDFLLKQHIQLPRDCLPEIARYNGRRVKIIENPKSQNAYLSDDFTLCIFDKRISAGVGEAIQLDDGSFKGYIQCGMHELPISGDDYRELASSAYSQILESDKY